MSSDSKFFLGVVVAAVLVIAGVVLFSGDKKLNTEEVDTSLGHKIGPDSAVVKIVEFGDFQCPACAAAAADYKKAQTQNPDSVQLIFKHFPLPSHPNGFIGSMAAEAAAKQGKFWEMYDLLYQQQQVWSASQDPTEIFVSYATQLALNVDTFRADLKNDSVKDVVERDRDYGLDLGVNSTPTFYINNKLVTGVQSIDSWQKLIDEAKAASTAATSEQTPATE